MSELETAIFHLMILTAEQEPHGSERIGLCEDAVKFADRCNEEQLGFQAR